MYTIERYRDDCDDSFGYSQFFATAANIQTAPVTCRVCNTFMYSLDFLGCIGWSLIIYVIQPLLDGLGGWGPCDFFV